MSCRGPDSRKKPDARLRQTELASNRSKHNRKREVGGETSKKSRRGRTKREKTNWGAASNRAGNQKLIYNRNRRDQGGSSDRGNPMADQWRKVKIGVGVVARSKHLGAAAAQCLVEICDTLENTGQGGGVRSKRRLSRHTFERGQCVATGG